MTKRTSVFLEVTIILLTCAFSLNGAWYDAQPSPRAPDVPSYPGFSSIDPSRNHFVVFGDTRGKSPWEFWLEKTGNVREEILQEITDNKPAFVINLGDLVLKGESTRSWLEFDRLHAGVREEGIPYFPVLGNHEMQGNTEAALRNYFKRFPHLSGQRWYSFIWKNVGFIMLDSNLSALTPAERSEQIRWYTAELERFEADAQVRYVIACTHEPPFTNRA